MALSVSSNAQNVQAIAPGGTIAAVADADRLWLVDTTSKSPPERIAEGNTYFFLPTWSRDGRLLAYYSRASGDLQLWVYDRETRRSRAITALAGGIDPDPLLRFSGYVNDPLRISWSPDGRRIAFSTRVAASASVATPITGSSYPTAAEIAAGHPVVLGPRTPPSWTLLGVTSFGSPMGRSLGSGSLSIKDVPRLEPARANQVMIVDVGSGRVEQLTHGDAGYVTPAWSPDGKSIAMMTLGGGPSVAFGPSTSDICVQRLVAGSCHVITGGIGQKTLPAWSPDGKRIAYFGRDSRPARRRGEEGIFVLSAAGGDARNVTHALERRVLSFAWGGDATTLILHYIDGIYHPLAAVDVSAASLRPLSSATVEVTSFSSSGGRTLWSEIPAPGAGSRWLFRERGAPRNVAVGTTQGLRATRQYELVRWRNGNGDALDGVLIYPKGYVGGRRYALVVDAYSLGSLDRVDTLNYVAAARDYFVFRPNHRAPHLWGNAFKDPAHDAGAVGVSGIDVMTDDILSGVAALAADRPAIDTDRMCVVGFSNGGLEAAQLLTRTNRFRCGVLQSPSSLDWASDFFLSTANPYVLGWMYGSAPWDDPALYTGLIPLYHADNIETPLLMAVGDREPAVLGTIEMYNALRLLGRDVTLLRYPNEGHGFGLEADRDFTARIRAFLQQHLR